MLRTSLVEMIKETSFCRPDNAGVFVWHASRKRHLRKKRGVGSVLRSMRCVYRGRYLSWALACIDVNPINQIQSNSILSYPSPQVLGL